jgi:hypothetical protein
MVESLGGEQNHQPPSENTAAVVSAVQGRQSRHISNVASSAGGIEMPNFAIDHGMIQSILESAHAPLLQRRDDVIAGEPRLAGHAQGERWEAPIGSQMHDAMIEVAERLARRAGDRQRFGGIDLAWKKESTDG